MQIVFQPEAFEQYSDWAEQDKNTFRRIRILLREILRTPFSGTGKPEPLKGNLKGCWSRRINLTHRLVYKVANDAIIVISCKFHY